MKRMTDLLKRNRSELTVWIAASLLNTAVFILYGIMAEALIYSLVLSFTALAVILTVKSAREKKRAEQRNRAIMSAVSGRTELPDADSPEEEDYQKIIEILERRTEQLSSQYDAERKEDIDYYTAWVHQIKTPIAVMKLKLSEDTVENRALSAQLLRIEQYADMVLQYIRLGSESNDLVINEYSLDDLVKESVRRIIPLFVEKKLRLEYGGTDLKIITDRKWFCCIMEQLLSNAVKYTPEGRVKISVEDSSLVISDTGIGIAAEDLPRIFELGFTGNNGRTGRRSSGLGLYLVKKASDMLSIPVKVHSAPGKGTVFVLELDQ